MPAQTGTLAEGQRAERAARSHLERSGLRTLCRNFRGRFGEIDLIMQDGPVIAFVEVRYRSSAGKLDPAETIDRRKCERIVKTAMQYMQTLKNPDQHHYRFDVITLTGSADAPSIDWIRDAFQA